MDLIKKFNKIKWTVAFLLFISFSSINAQSGRTITFVNNCSYPVWFATSGGAVQGKLSGTQCNTNNDCYEGATCTQTGTIKQCFWTNPIPTNRNFALTANGGTNQVTLPIYNDGLANIWSGVIGGRTNCVNGVCQTADCGNANGACSSGQGLAQPATQAEFTFSLNGLDFYDVEVINGVNIPISITPNLSAPENNTNPYSCGSPGAAAQSSSSLLGACSWSFTPPSNDYIWVTSGGSACTELSDCTSPSVCGLSFNAGNAQLFQKTCGTPLGYWTADQICTIDQNYGAPFNCAQAASNNLTLWNLYACIGLGSCYGSDSSDCCGCVNWNTIGIDVPPAPYTAQCGSSNADWVGNAQPTLTWLKSACPTAYVYPFDDPSSTFTCSSMENNVNTLNYTITYCPAGSGGNPTPPPINAFSYTLYLGAPFIPVTINGSITCPDPETGNPVCLVSNQNAGSTMTIVGSNHDICNLEVQSNGSIVVGSESVGCYINSTPSTPTTPGTINLPGGF